MFNSLVFMCERSLEVTFGNISVLVIQINLLERMSVCFKSSYDKKCENCDNLGLKIKILPTFRLYQKILQWFVSFCINLIFRYRLFAGKDWWRLKSSFLIFQGGRCKKCVTKWQFLLILLKRVEKDPFLRPQIRAKDTFRWNIPALSSEEMRQIFGVVFGQDEILVKLSF